MPAGEHASDLQRDCGSDPRGIQERHWARLQADRGRQGRYSYLSPPHMDFGMLVVSMLEWLHAGMAISVSGV